MIPATHLEDLLARLESWRHRSAAEPDLLVRVSRPVYDAATEAVRELLTLKRQR